MALNMRDTVLLFLLCLTMCIAETLTAKTTLSATISSSQNGSPASSEGKLRNQIIMTVVSSLSLFGSVAIIATYFLWRDLQTTSRKILVFVSIGDFFTVYPNMVIFWTRDYDDNGFSCKFQSFVTSTAVMWSFFWTTSLAIYLYTALVKKHYDISERLMAVFHLVNWCLPASLVGIAWYKGRLGYHKNNKSTVGWCWIHADDNDHARTIIWMLICGKLWEIISYFVNFVLYFLVRRNIKNEVSARYHLLSSQSLEIAVQGRRKVILVPVVFVVLRIWGTIRFVVFAFDHWHEHIPDVMNQILITLQVIGDNAQGIANFILFCVLTEKFKRNVFRVIRCGNFMEYKALISEKTKSRNNGGTFSDTTQFSFRF